jgi:hypothetical protein
MPYEVEDACRSYEAEATQRGEEEIGVRSSSGRRTVYWREIGVRRRIHECHMREARRVVELFIGRSRLSYTTFHELWWKKSTICLLLLHQLHCLLLLLHHLQRSLEEGGARCRLPEETTY